MGLDRDLLVQLWGDFAADFSDQSCNGVAYLPSRLACLGRSKGAGDRLRSDGENLDAGGSDIHFWTVPTPKGVRFVLWGDPEAGPQMEVAPSAIRQPTASGENNR